jgi:hypothetical protein
MFSMYVALYSAPGLLARRFNMRARDCAGIRAGRADGKQPAPWTDHIAWKLLQAFTNSAISTVLLVLAVASIGVSLYSKLRARKENSRVKGIRLCALLIIKKEDYLSALSLQKANSRQSMWMAHLIANGRRRVRCLSELFHVARHACSQ